MKTNQHRAGGNNNRPAQSKQARKTAGATQKETQVRVDVEVPQSLLDFIHHAAVEEKCDRDTFVRRAISEKLAREAYSGLSLPDRQFVDVVAYSSSEEFAQRRREREQRPEADRTREREEAYARRLKSETIISPFPGMAHCWEFTAKDVLLFLSRVLYTHREKIKAVCDLRDDIALGCFIAQTDAAGLAVPETFRLGFLDGIASKMRFTHGDALAMIEAVWCNYAQEIHDRVWRPLVRECPRSALEVAQALALAELASHQSGCLTEIEIVGEGGETTAQFYARWNGELLAARN